MALDFQQVQKQIQRHVATANAYLSHLEELRKEAVRILQAQATDYAHIHERIEHIVRYHDPNIRCALPASALEPLNAHYPLPPLPAQATLLAADGSQILPSRHREINFALINLGAIQMHLGSATTPQTSTFSHLYYGDELLSLSEAQLALKRDLKEREILLELSKEAAQPVIGLTDGPIELWGAREGLEEGEFEQHLQEYLQTLENLRQHSVVTCGYVDKPAANLVVRTLEALSLSDAQLPDIRHHFPLRGVVDFDLFCELLEAGERSALFSMQSRSSAYYHGELALSFFYLNVGTKGKPWLARVEIPAWVGKNHTLLNALHAVLVEQCHILGSRPYPYLLHRAHEAARVTLEEQAQVVQMFIVALAQRGIPPGQPSAKQALKDLPGRIKHTQ